MKLSVYQANGFYLLSEIKPDGLLHYPVAAGINIVKGDYVIPSSGYATNTATAFQIDKLGIAHANADNSSGAAAAINVAVIPLLPHLQFSVPVANNAVISRAYVGDAYDLENNDDIDLSDTSTATSALAFFIDDFDACTDAVTANTYGYAIGHFVMNA